VADIDGPERLIQQLAPIWSRQLSTARDISDDAIGDLTEQFNNIVYRLEGTIKASMQSSQGIVRDVSLCFAG
jgi:methyl-accepting chemotaxis protein